MLSSAAVAFVTDEVWPQSGRFVGQGKISYLPCIILFTQPFRSELNH
jgi:hypothetical protein